MTSPSPAAGEIPGVAGAPAAGAPLPPNAGATAPEKSRGAAGVKRPGDRITEFASAGSASLVTVAIAAIGVFLLYRAIPSLRNNAANFLTYSADWNLRDVTEMYFGIPNLFAVTVAVSVVALVFAMPVALGVAIFLTSYAPARAVKPLAYLIDLLAAVPSIVYGLWGFMALGPALSRFYEWLAAGPGRHVALFEHYANSPAFATGRNLFTGGIVLAIMILPVIAATTREVFVQTPRGHVEAALALGATRWETVRMAVLPFGKSGFISGSMLGLGRALGETMALYMVLAPTSEFRWSLLDGGTTFATAIANAAPEFNDDLKAGAYMAAGLVLFLLTFVVNSAARVIAKK